VPRRPRTQPGSVTLTEDCCPIARRSLRGGAVGIANGKWLPPVPPLVWWIADEIKERRAAKQAREEMHVRERFEALAARF
jgi:hypothetical protein